MKLKFKILLASLVAVMMWSCESKTNSSVSSDVPVIHSTKVGDPHTVASLEIEGMMCETACGGKIRKELEAVEGVKVATIDFDAERSFNQAIVEFDASKITEKELINAVETIADGKLYHVKSVEITNYTPDQKKSSRLEVKEESQFEVSTVFEFPNVVRILEKLIR